MARFDHQNESLSMKEKPDSLLKVGKPKLYLASKHICRFKLKYTSGKHYLYVECFPYMIALKIYSQKLGYGEYSGRIIMNSFNSDFIAERRSKKNTVLSDLRKMIRKDMKETLAGFPIERCMFRTCEVADGNTLIIHTDNPEMKLKMVIVNESIMVTSNLKNKSSYVLRIL